MVWTVKFSSWASTPESSPTARSSSAKQNDAVRIAGQARPLVARRRTDHRYHPVVTTIRIVGTSGKVAWVTTSSGVISEPGRFPGLIRPSR